MDAPTNNDMVELIEQAYSSIEEVCSQLDDGDWDKPTDLKGWSVKDNLAHLAHYEAHAAGRPSPDDIDVGHRAHVKDDFQIRNERGVEYRRPWPGAKVLDEFREATTERAKVLRGLDPDGWEQPVSLPAGDFQQGQILAIRTMDLYYHEQDIRRAVGKPGHLNGDVARFAFGRLARGMGMVTAKHAGAPDGTRVRFAIGEPGRTFDIVVEDGRGNVKDPEGEPTATFSGDFETFLCVAGGRWSPERAISDGRWIAEGDPEQIAKIHERISVIP